MREYSDRWVALVVFLLIAIPAAYFSGAHFAQEQELKNPVKALEIYQELGLLVQDLENGRANILAFDQKLREIWQLIAQENRTLLVEELDIMILKYAGTAMAYNRIMERTDYRFADTKRLPPGAEKPLPRRIDPLATHSVPDVRM
jgi:hypothetical protein